MEQFALKPEDKSQVEPPWGELEQRGWLDPCEIERLIGIEIGTPETKNTFLFVSIKSRCIGDCKDWMPRRFKV